MRKTIGLVAGVSRHLRFGYPVVSAYLRNQRSLWSIPKSENQHPIQSSSISDDGRYTQVVRLASENLNIFSKFRSNSDYFGILDHVSFSQAEGYRQVLREREPVNVSVPFIRGFSDIGSPLTYPFEGFDFEVAPTLFRYLKVASDIRLLFEDAVRSHVTEIGIGFGGQVATFAEMKLGATFDLFDLPEVNSLAKRFIGSLGVNAEIVFRDGRAPESSQPGLVVSNYAFSELTRPVQEAYLHSVLIPSKAGYITWNDLSQTRLGGFSVDELLTLLPRAEIFEERPRTHPNNLIVAWGHIPGTTLYKS